MTDLWTEASRDVEAEEHLRRVTAAKLSVVKMWPFLAAAEGPSDFGNRLALLEERLATAVPDDADRAEVVASLTHDFNVLDESRFRARQAAKEAGGLPDALKEHQFGKDDDEGDEGKEAARVEASQKVTCAACNNKQPAKATCGTCGGKGYFLVNATKPQLASKHAAGDKMRVSQNPANQGKWTVQKFYPDTEIWADVGDPVGSRADAEAKLESERSKTGSRRPFVPESPEGGETKTSKFIAAMKTAARRLFLEEDQPRHRKVAEFPWQKAEGEAPAEGEPPVEGEAPADPAAPVDPAAGGDLGTAQVGQQVTLHYKLADGTEGDSPATVTVNDGTTITFTYDKGTFKATNAGGVWKDTLGTEFTLGASGSAGAAPAPLTGDAPAETPPATPSTPPKPDEKKEPKESALVAEGLAPIPTATIDGKLVYANPSTTGQPKNAWIAVSWKGAEYGVEEFGGATRESVAKRTGGRSDVWTIVETAKHEWTPTPFRKTPFYGAKGGNPYGSCPKCGSGRYRKDLKVCTQCGYKGSTARLAGIGREMADAAMFLGGLRTGDMVTVVIDGRDHQMTVSRALQGQDHAYEGDVIVPAGSLEFSAVKVTFGVGRYSTNVTVHQQASKNPGMPYIKEGTSVISTLVQGADDGSIFCKRCGGSGMVRAGGVVTNCKTCKGSGLKPKPRKTVEDAVGGPYTATIKEAAYGDPYWTTARYGGMCGGKNCYDTINPGDEIFFYPKGRSALVGACADAAARDFASMAADEEYGSAYFGSKTAAGLAPEWVDLDDPYPGIICPHCGEHISLELKHLGSVRFCSGCGMKIKVGGKTANDYTNTNPYATAPQPSQQGSPPDPAGVGKPVTTKPRQMPPGTPPVPDPMMGAPMDPMAQAAPAAVPQPQTAEPVQPPVQAALATKVPVKCEACGRQSSWPLGTVMAGLVCACGCTDFDLDDTVGAMAPVEANWTFPCPKCGSKMKLILDGGGDAKHIYKCNGCGNTVSHEQAMELAREGAKTALDYDFGVGGSQGDITGIFRGLINHLLGGGGDKIPRWFPKSYLTPEEIAAGRFLVGGPRGSMEYAFGAKDDDWSEDDDKAVGWLTEDLPAMRKTVKAEHPDWSAAQVAAEAIKRLGAKLAEWSQNNTAPATEVEAVREDFRCSSCFAEFTDVALDPAAPLPSCPACGSEATTAAGAILTPTRPTTARTVDLDEAYRRLRSQHDEDDDEDEDEKAEQDQKAAKVVQIASGILSTNPGMTREAAITLAEETVRRYPKVAAA